MSSDHKFKLAKDSLVSSLFELSKAASQSASSVLDFYHCIQDENYDLDQAFLTLQQSLSLLGQGTNQLEAVVNQFGDKVGFKLVDQVSDLDANSLLAASGKKKKAKKDPFAPKKPLTIFFAYTAYVRESIIQERKEKSLSPLSQIELTQTISQMWRELDDEQKQKWKMSYNHELEVYNKRKEEYLEARKNGILINFNEPGQIKSSEAETAAVSSPSVPEIPEVISEEAVSKDENISLKTDEDAALGSKRPHDDDDAEKKKKKKKSKKAKKEKKAAAAAAAAAAAEEAGN